MKKYVCSFILLVPRLLSRFLIFNPDQSKSFSQINFSSPLGRLGGAFIFLFFTSCKKENSCDCIKSTGEVTTEERIAEEFQEIELNDKINLYITQDTVQKLSVEAGENLLSSIKTQVKDKRLIIKNNNRCNWIRSYKKKVNVYVSVKTLNYLLYQGSGDIYTKNMLKADALLVESKDGSGSIKLLVDLPSLQCLIKDGTVDITAEGNTESSNIQVGGNGCIHFQELKSNYTVIKNSGTGNCYIWVQDKLEAHLNGIGDIYYKGDPSITSTEYGKGRLISY